MKKEIEIDKKNRIGKASPLNRQVLETAIPKQDIQIKENKVCGNLKAIDTNYNMIEIIFSDGKFYSNGRRIKNIDSFLSGGF